MEHFDAGSALDILEHYGVFARPIIGIVGNLLAIRKNALDAAHLRRQDAEIARLTEESRRTQDMVQTLVVSLDDYESRGILTSEMLRRRIEDPELEQFIRRAVDASAASKLESKRHVFGRFVAKRILTDEEDEIVLLRRGMALTSDLVETQLLAIAGIVMIQNLAVPASSFPDRAAAEAFAKLHFAGAIERFRKKPWSESDLETLGSVGALGGGLRGGVALWGDSGESSLDRWFRENGVTQDDVLNDPEFGTGPAQQRYVKTYPTLHQLSRLGTGHLFDGEAVRVQDADINRLDTLDVTPVGFVMGQTILEQLVSSSSPAATG